LIGIGILFAVVIGTMALSAVDNSPSGQPDQMIVCLRQGIQAADILQTVPAKEDEWTRFVRSATSTVAINPVMKSYSFSDYGLHFKLPAEWEATSTIAGESNSLLIRISAPPLKPGLPRLPIVAIVAGKAARASVVPEVLVSPSYPNAVNGLTFILGTTQYRLFEAEGFVLSRDGVNLRYLLSTLNFTCLGR